MTAPDLTDTLLGLWVATPESPYWWEVTEESADALTLRTRINNGRMRTRRGVRRSLVTEAHTARPRTLGDSVRPD